MEVLLTSRSPCLKNQKVAESDRFRCDSRTCPPGNSQISYASVAAFLRMIFRNFRGKFPGGYRILKFNQKKWQEVCFGPTRWGPLTTISRFIPSYNHLQPWLNRVCWGYNYLITRGAPFLNHQAKRLDHQPSVGLDSQELGQPIDGELARLFASRRSDL